MSMAIGPDFPNYFIVNGPNSSLGSGSLLVLFEREVDYIVEAIAKMQRENIKAMSVKQGAVDDFMEYVDVYFRKTVYSEKCRSWYKKGLETGYVPFLSSSSLSRSSFKPPLPSTAPSSPSGPAPACTPLRRSRTLAGRTTTTLHRRSRRTGSPGSDRDGRGPRWIPRGTRLSISTTSISLLPLSRCRKKAVELWLLKRILSYGCNY
jgi:hypothetical protein